MAEYIDREAYIKTVKDIPMWGSVAAMMADCVPAADVVEVKHGEWIWSEENECWVCRCCEMSALNNYRGNSTASNYCPNCGARMDGE